MDAARLFNIKTLRFFRRSIKFVLNGWQRLWVLLAVLYAFLVATVAWSFFPGPRNVAHEGKFYEQIPVATRRNILNSQVDPRKEEAFLADVRALMVHDTVVLMDMPNDRTLVFRKVLPEADQTAASRGRLVCNWRCDCLGPARL